MTAKELYRAHADGRDDRLLELDDSSAVAFSEWFNDKRLRIGHPWEVCRGGNSTHISLYVKCDDDGWWLVLAGDSYSRSVETIKFYLALVENGLPVFMQAGKELLAMVTGCSLMTMFFNLCICLTRKQGRSSKKQCGNRLRLLRWLVPSEMCGVFSSESLSLFQYHGIMTASSHYTSNYKATLRGLPVHSPKESTMIKGTIISLIPATMDDRQNVYDWCFQSETTKSHSGPPDYPYVYVPSFEEFCADYYYDYFFTGEAPQDGMGFIITQNDERVGFISCCAFHMKPHMSELDLWMNSEANCGKGYGTDALITLMDYLSRELGIREFIIRPSVKNARAIRSYKKAGFEESADSPNDYLLEEYVSLYGDGDYGAGETAFFVRRMENTFIAKIERFEMPGGWHYVPVPTELSVPLEFLAINFGFIAITATVGNSSWPTSLLPKGDGTHFIALPAKVRTKEKLYYGDEIEVSFEPRMR